MNARKTFAWSVRRELWEHRAIYIAPLVVAALALLAFLVGVARHAGDVGAMPLRKLTVVITTPYSMVSYVILLAGFLVGLFYCLDALHAEKRDRSILFWKSMPVSDTTTVLAKAFIPLAVLPVVVLGAALATQVAMLLASSLLLAVLGGDAALQWKVLPLGELTVQMLYGTVVHTLWYAPLYGYLLLISVFAKRAPFLWAAVPPVGAVVVEKIAFGTSFFFDFVRYRATGAAHEAFTPRGAGLDASFPQLEPMRFLSSIGLWTGLVAAALMIGCAIYIRRRRDAS